MGGDPQKGNKDNDSNSGNKHGGKGPGEHGNPSDGQNPAPAQPKP